MQWVVGGYFMNIARRTFNGIDFQIYEWGDPERPKLFLLHGWMDTGASFDFVARYLSDAFYLIAPDLRGFGKTGHSPNPLGYFFYEYIPDLHALFNAYSPDEPLRILGHSMGGNIASLYAGTFSERVSHLINVEGFGISDTAPERGPDRMRKWVEALGMPMPGFRPYPDRDALADRLRIPNPHLTLEQARFIADSMGESISNGVRLAADPKHKLPSPYLFQLQNAIPFWQRIAAQCLLVYGEKTSMGVWLQGEGDLKAEISRRLAHFPKSSQVVEMKDCGHMIHHERPQELAEHIRKFLS